MPFTGPSDSKLPSNVAHLSLETRRQWVGAWNGRFEDCKKDGGSTADCESSAFAVANAAIKELQMDAESVDGQVGVADKNKDEDYGEWSQPSRADYWDYIERQVEQEAAAYDPIGGTDTKACANCQWFVAPSGCTIVTSYPQPILPTGLSNLWRKREVYESKPIEVTIVGEAALAGEKAETKTEGGVDYAASDYAVVPDAAKSSTWKLRVAEGSSGAITVAQVGRAITAMQPSGFRGNRVQLTADQKTQAISRIGTAIGKTEGTDAQKDNLRDRLDKVKESGTIDRTLRAIRKALPARLQAILGVPGNGTVDPAPARSSLKVYKDAQGTYRFVAWASNKWRDRDYPPEIITEEAHKEHVAYLDESKNYPAMWLWHTPGTKWGQVDWADYADGFFIVSGTVDGGKEAIAEKLAQDTDLGVSHGFVHGYEDSQNGIIGRYRTFEVSPLPHNVAANPWTSVEVIKKEGDMGFNDAKRSWLVEKLGEDEVARLEAGTKSMAEALTAAGIEFKDVPADEKPGTKPAEGKETPSQDTQAKDLADALADSPALKSLGETLVSLKERLDKTDATITDLTNRLTEAEKSDDEKLAALITARSNGQKVAVEGQRASESTSNVVDEEVARKEAEAQGPNFLDEIVAGISSN